MGLVVHAAEHRYTGRESDGEGRESLDSVRGDVVTVTARAPGAGHPECGSRGAEGPEISSKFGHGGPRANSGGPRANSGGARRGAGRKPAPPPPAIASGKPGLRWFCLQTAPRAELLAVVHLTTKGFATFLPLHQTGVGQVLRPLFPGWLFVQFDHQAGRWGAINGTPGVRELHSDTPLASDLVVELIALYGPGGKAVYPPGAHAMEPIEAGKLVRVTSGDVIDLVGIVQWSDGDKVRLLAEMMGGQVRVTVQRHQVEEVKQ
jgi:transcriptional antiterminator RfaH